MLSPLSGGHSAAGPVPRGGPGEHRRDPPTPARPTSPAAPLSDFKAGPALAGLPTAPPAAPAPPRRRAHVTPGPRRLRLPPPLQCPRLGCAAGRPRRAPRAACQPRRDMARAVPRRSATPERGAAGR